MPVLATTLVGGLLVLAGYAGSGVLAVAVVGLAALLAYGLLGSGDLPEPVPAGGLIVLTAAGASIAVLVSDVQVGAETSFAPVLRAGGPAMVAVILVGLARRAARERAVPWLAATSAGVVLAALTGAFVALGRLDDLGPELVAIAAVGAAVGSAAALSGGGYGWLWGLVPLAVAAGAPFLVPVGEVAATDRLVLTAAAALAAAIGARAVTSGVPAGHWTVRALRVACVALASAAPVVAVVVRPLIA